MFNVIESERERSGALLSGALFGAQLQLPVVERERSGTPILQLELGVESAPNFAGAPILCRGVTSK